ncbi:MAG: excinuclease ABC subunit UvrC [Candidatus Doudnabacteria bacterium]|nr:excinuclease ABC subunit UvrC [Candidatus Doudnabacteria bacterium]
MESSSSKNLKSKTSQLPQQPGIYQFLDAKGRVLYVGKAKNLRSRVRQYFGHDDTRAQIPFLMAEAADINYTVVNNELESAFLENTLIKQYSPRFNIDLKDDKNYAFIKIDYSTQIPQIGYARKVETRSEYYKLHPNTPKGINSDNSPACSVGRDGIRRLGSRYFGPYSAAYKIRNTLNLVRKVFSFCANDKVSSRPCFYYYMHRCPGVCIGKISLDEYNRHLEKIIKFLQGDTAGVYSEIKKEMQKAAEQKKFETAARLRDQLRALELLTEKQNVILAKKVDWDVISLAAAENNACINLFKVRGGKLFDKENFIYQLPSLWRQNGHEAAASEIINTFLQKYYLETSSLPKEIFLQYPINGESDVAGIIFQHTKKRIKISVPQKSQAAKLISLGAANADEYLKNWMSAQAGHLDKINASLAQLQQTLKLKAIPKRIECYDISNIQGTNPVGSMVVFKDGLPAKSEYRKFKIYGKNTPDDFAMMTEMLKRRMARIKNKESSKTDKTHWPKPDLIVIDGGKGQLNAALTALRISNPKFLISKQTPNSKTQIPIIGLAKRIEEIFLPNKEHPIILGHDQPGLQLLQRLRDEAHRFGITFHRNLRSKQAVKSALDDIPGIGPKTKKLLKTKFGTVAEIKKASEDDLAMLVGKKLAQTIKQSL